MLPAEAASDPWPSEPMVHIKLYKNGQNKRVLVTTSKYQRAFGVGVSQFKSPECLSLIFPDEKVSPLCRDRGQNMDEYFVGLIGSHYLITHLYQENKTSELRLWKGKQKRFTNIFTLVATSVRQGR